MNVYATKPMKHLKAILLLPKISKSLIYHNSISIFINNIF
ncbi:hypothetical protein J633_2749 [Acinetobacter sp. 216872]|nr:hypothetical protein J633_2749 [Acinetobacter sp. 216872]